MNQAQVTDSRPKGNIYSFGEGRAARLYDMSKANHEATKESLSRAMAIAKDRDVDGAIIILTRNNGGSTSIVTAGSMNKHERANLELFKLKLKMAIEY
jgi:hypothetical protein